MALPLANFRQLINAVRDDNRALGKPVVDRWLENIVANMVTDDEARALLTDDEKATLVLDKVRDYLKALYSIAPVVNAEKAARKSARDSVEIDHAEIDKSN